MAKLIYQAMRKHIRHGLDDSPWARVELLLATVDYHVVRRARLSDRDFLHAVCWILKTGAPWRDLPHEFGSWHLVYKRFARWRRRGVVDTVFNALTVDADREAAMIDGSYVRAHQASVGGKKTGDECIGPSRGGRTTKIHGAVDALGNPLHVHLTPGNVHDIVEAPRLIAAIGRARALIADKGYDANAVVALAHRSGMLPVISQTSNRLAPLIIDRSIYKHRFLVENFFQKIKRARRVHFRFEKLALRFLTFVVMACILVWLA